MLTCSPEDSHDGHLGTQLCRLLGSLAVLVNDANVRVVPQEHSHALNVPAAGRQVHGSVAAVGAAIYVAVPCLDQQVVQDTVMAAGHGLVQRSVAEDSLAVGEAVLQSYLVGAVRHKLFDPLQLAALAQLVESRIVPHIGGRRNATDKRWKKEKAGESKPCACAFRRVRKARAHAQKLYHAPSISSSEARVPSVLANSCYE